MPAKKTAKKTAKKKTARVYPVVEISGDREATLKSLEAAYPSFVFTTRKCNISDEVLDRCGQSKLLWKDIKEGGSNLTVTIGSDIIVRKVRG
jgi:hypothetical protein